MGIAKYIFVAVLAALIGSFTIELPYTQVNYIHSLVKKKAMSGFARKNDRIHKTYYEQEKKFSFILIALFAPALFLMNRGRQRACLFLQPVNFFHPFSGLRGPPFFIL